MIVVHDCCTTIPQAKDLIVVPIVISKMRIDAVKVMRQFEAVGEVHDAIRTIPMFMNPRPVGISVGSVSYTNGWSCLLAVRRRPVSTVCHAYSLCEQRPCL